jgi:Na+/phosphate symporter
MKKLLIILFVVLMAGVTLYSQEAYKELIMSDLKTQKVALITLNMELTDAESDVFWPVYRKYDAELTTLTDERIALIKDYAANYEKMTDAKAEALTKQSFSLMGKRLKLQEKYYGEFAKALNPVLAAKFMMIERQINALVDLQIGSSLPLITK